MVTINSLVSKEEQKLGAIDMLEFLATIKSISKKVFAEKVLKEVSIREIVYPRRYYPQRSEHLLNDARRKEIYDALRCYEIIRNEKMKDLTNFYIPPTFDELDEFKMLRSTVSGSFYKVDGIDSKTSWTEIFKENVNFEGYAYWNAAMFVWVARNIVKLNKNIIIFALQHIRFNENSVSPEAMWGIEGEGVVESGFSLKDELELWEKIGIEFKNTFKDEITNNLRRFTHGDLSKNKRGQQHRTAFFWIVDRAKKRAKKSLESDLRFGEREKPEKEFKNN